MKDKLLLLSLTVFLLILTSQSIFSQAPKIMQTDTTDHSNENTTLNNRKSIKLHLIKARDYVKKGRYQDALENYMLFLDKSKNFVEFAGIRLSIVLSEIIELCKLYTPSCSALKNRKNMLENQVTTQVFDSKSVMEIKAINKYLGESNLTIEFYDKYKSNTKVSITNVNQFTSIIWRELAKEKRYYDLEDILQTLVKKVALLISEYQIEIEFTNKPFNNKPGYGNWLESAIIEDSMLLYEVLLGLNKDQKAEKLKQWIFKYSCNKLVYSNLIEAAKKAKRKDIANKLIKEAP